MVPKLWFNLFFLTILFLMSACTPGETEEVIVTRTGQPPVTPITATATIEITAVNQRPEPTTTATSTPFPTNTATPTPTPTALPLTTHSWDAEPVLIEYNSRVCTDACVGIYFSALPNLILYSDGRLIINRYDPVTRYDLLGSKALTQNEVCKLLNTIDLIGFLDYDPTAYYQQIDQLNLFPSYEPPTYLNVNVWKSNAVNATGIRYFLEGGFHEGELELDPPLSLTYKLLNNLSEQPLEPYVPERIIVSIEKRVSPEQLPDYIGQEQGEWPLTDISLQTLFEASGGGRFIIEDAAEIATLSNLFLPESAPSSQIYTENGQRYEIAIRSLLPFETLESIGGAVGARDIIPGPDVPPSTTPLTCTPEDGVLDVYFSLLEGEI